MCCNQSINRKLTNEALHVVVDYMISNGTAEYVTKLKDKIYIHYTSIQEYAGAIYQWAKDMGKMNQAEAIIDLVENEENKKYIFYGSPPELILKACRALEREKKAEVFCSEKSKEYGVKFFYM